jgi:nicotinate-nucleotide adenylyltransferase
MGMEAKRRLGIMGGTFDPVHYGHLAIAQEAKYRFDLEKVIFIPCGIPPHKKEYRVSSAEHRLKMTYLAIQDNPEFEISRLEVDRPGNTYSVETVTELQQVYPDARFFFIAGADAILELLSWKEPQRLINMCNLVAVTRPGYDIANLQQQIGEELAAKITVLAVPGIDISSTEIRARVAQAAPIRYLLPENVREYIEKEKLYLVEK